MTSTSTVYNHEKHNNNKNNCQPQWCTRANNKVTGVTKAAVRPRYDRSILCLMCYWLSAGLRHPVYSVDVMAAACCKAVVAYSEYHPKSLQSSCIMRGSITQQQLILLNMFRTTCTFSCAIQDSSLNDPKQGIYMGTHRHSHPSPINTPLILPRLLFGPNVPHSCKCHTHICIESPPAERVLQVNKFSMWHSER